MTAYRGEDMNRHMPASWDGPGDERQEMHTWEPKKKRREKGNE